MEERIIFRLDKEDKDKFVEKATDAKKKPSDLLRAFIKRFNKRKQ